MVEEPKIGAVVEVVFLDHTEDERLYRFTTYGRVAAVDGQCLVLHGWHHTDQPTEPDPENTAGYALVRSAIERIRVLSYAPALAD